LHRELAETRSRGYALDDQENEAGVNCLALPAYAVSPTTPSGAVSVSALAYRTPLRALTEGIDDIRKLLGPLNGPHPR
jgi:DNA-binding IclR family transcriptional regulator